MFARNWVLGLVYSLTGVTFVAVTACSAGAHKEEEEARDTVNAAIGGKSSRSFGTGGVSLRDPATGGSRNLGTGGASSREFGTGGASQATGGASSRGESTGGSAATSSVSGASSKPACTPSTSADVPDNDGIDSNCDGIDGDAASSLFVSPAGLDSDSGTKAAPFRTIGHAISIALASASARDILVCEGNYAENLKVPASMGLHGGYDCKTWARTGLRSVVAPSSGVALRIEGVSKPMRLSKFTLQSADASAAGASSQAVQIIDSKGVSIDHCAIVAGNGARGEAGAVPTNSWSGTAPAGQDGAALQLDTADTSIGCHDTSYFGDSDFDGYTDVSNDQKQSRCTLARAGGAGVSNTCVTPGQSAPVTYYGGKGGNGGIKPNAEVPTAPGVGTAGSPSSALAAATPGVPGKGFGSVVVTGYVASNDGTNGSMGQPGVAGVGGNGGDACLLRVGNMNTTDPHTQYMPMYKANYYVATTCAVSDTWGGAPINVWATYVYGQAVQIRTVTMFPGSGGGGGGAPGCGGSAGSGGKGGGASIALFVSNSDVTITWSDITAGNGGAGGDASDGAAGQLGGNGGLGGAVLATPSVKLPTLSDGTLLISETNLKGKDGTKGGQGQKGTAGGPGGGGPSVAILWDGTTKPNFDTTVTLKMGSGGLAGKLIEGTTPASAGISADCISVDEASTK